VSTTEHGKSINGKSINGKSSKASSESHAVLGFLFFEEGKE
jgi:hypothetical protein